MEHQQKYTDELFLEISMEHQEKYTVLQKRMSIVSLQWRDYINLIKK